ncbi:MAG TPA: hypothetical protein ENF73_04390 [Proteobacteria bacterium]|nr:hypothetical protein [Pseudomonadota bacterium]
MLKRFAMFVFLFVFPFVALAGSSFGGYTETLLNSSYSEVSFEIGVRSFDMQSVHAGGMEFTRLLLDGAGVVGEVGTPELPAIRELVWIPEGATVSLEVETPEKDVLKLDQAGYPELVYPVQPPRLKVEGVDPEFAFDASAYQLDEYLYLDCARIVDSGYLRGRRFVTVEVRPLAYNPRRGTLIVRSRIVVRLKLRGADPQATEARIERYDDYYHWLLARSVFINPDGFDSKQSVGIPQTPIGFLVIAPPEYAGDENLNAYLSWRRQMGYQVTVLSTDETTSDAANIRGWITAAYQGWDVPPTFVLLVGDTNSIGYFDNQAPSDLYFAAIDGEDYFPDIFVGRLPVRSGSDLQNMINKITVHERVLWSVGDDWITKAAFMASTDNYQISEGTHEFVINTFLEPAGYVCDRLYSRTFHAKTWQVIAALNEGRSLAIYSGHGSEHGWVDGPPLDDSDVRSLVNPVYPLVCSFACLTGAYDVAECFGETWVRTANGAVAFWGSSVPSYWDEDDILERKQFEGFFANPAGVNLTWIEGMFQYGKIGVYEHWGNTETVQRYFEMYNCLGDPSLDIWTAAPVSLVPDVPSAVEPAAPLVVSVGIERALVGVTSGGGVLGSAFTDSTGVATIPLPELPDGTELLVTVTGHNLMPYQGTTVVGSEPADDDTSDGGGSRERDGESDGDGLLGCGCSF